MTQTFHVVNTTFERSCMVSNVTDHTWRQKKTDKNLSLSSNVNGPLLSVSCDHDHRFKTSNYDKKTVRFVSCNRNVFLTRGRRQTGATGEAKNRDQTFPKKYTNYRDTFFQIFFSET